MSVERISTEPAYLEKVIIKGMLFDKHYSVLVSNTFVGEYFDLPEVRKIFSFISTHLKEFNKLPPKELVRNTVKDAEGFLDDVEDLTIDLVENYDWLINETNLYLRDKALKISILKSVDLLEKDPHGDRTKIRGLVEEALTKNLKMDLGLNYWADIPKRLKIISESNDVRIPTYYPTLDEYLIGGFPKRASLSAICGATFAGKSQFAINLGERQSLNGHTVVIFTLEMDESSYAARIDSSCSGLDINRMYVDEKSLGRLLKELKGVKDSHKPGPLIIKDFPTGSATPNNLIVFIRELIMRDIIPDIVYIDYIGIMKGSHPEFPYLNIKFLSEELRAMGAMFDIPVVTFHQINREGRRVPFRELSGIFVAESSALEHTCDFMALIGHDEDAMTYENTIFWKIVKNRFGGRKVIVPFFADYCSLKIYDETEMDLWLEDAKKSGDARNIFSNSP